MSCHRKNQSTACKYWRGMQRNHSLGRWIFWRSTAMCSFVFVPEMKAWSSREKINKGLHDSDDKTRKDSMPTKDIFVPVTVTRAFIITGLTHRLRKAQDWNLDDLWTLDWIRRAGRAPVTENRQQLLHSYCYSKISNAWPAGWLAEHPARIRHILAAVREYR